MVEKSSKWNRKMGDRSFNIASGAVGDTTAYGRLQNLLIPIIDRVGPVDKISFIH